MLEEESVCMFLPNENHIDAKIKMIPGIKSP